MLYLSPYTEEYAFMERATGPYAWVYWFMVVGNIFLPLVLLHRNLRRNIYVILLFTIMIYIGWLFEMLVIQVTSFNSDYSNETVSAFDSFDRESIILLKEFILGMVVLIIENTVSFLTRNNQKST